MAQRTQDNVDMATNQPVCSAIAIAGELFSCRCVVKNEGVEQRLHPSSISRTK